MREQFAFSRNSHYQTSGCSEASFRRTKKQNSRQENMRILSIIARGIYAGISLGETSNWAQLWKWP